ncbi:MAG: hypothetical protein OES20_19020 [Gammaproteobacteria bacterium]|nr:hypothetical protein [Gammaproteobacteria bacterium]
MAKLSIGLIVISLVLGGLIELSQYATDRTPDILDLVRDLTGVFLALIFLGRYNGWLKRRPLNSLKTTVVILLVWLTIPLAKALADEIIAYRQFPVLANNDTPFELDRWGGNADIEIVQIDSTNLLKLQLTPGKQYPGTGLVYFPGDWSGYKLLVIRLLNPAVEPLEMTIRVHDRAHETSFLYRDRFHQGFRIRPGWNDLEIELSEIEKAPEDRDMNMQQISELIVFTNRLTQNKTLFIDEIYLTR